jgi:hypothetical protein
MVKIINTEANLQRAQTQANVSESTSQAKLPSRMIKHPRLMISPKQSLGLKHNQSELKKYNTQRITVSMRTSDHKTFVEIPLDRNAE